MEANTVGLVTQYAAEDAVEGAHPQLGCGLLSHLCGNARLHLTGSLVGKGECQNLPGLVTLCQQIGYLKGQHARLATARTGNYQHGGICAQDGLALTFVQFVKIHTLYIMEDVHEAGVVEADDKKEQKPGAESSDAMD